MFIGCWICGNKIEEKFELPRKRSWNDSVTVCKECYEKWKRIIGSHPERADKMIKALERQLIEERGNLAYFRQFIVWLNKRIYQRYSSDTKIETNETEAV